MSEREKKNIFLLLFSPVNSSFYNSPITTRFRREARSIFWKNGCWKLIVLDIGNSTDSVPNNTNYYYWSDHVTRLHLTICTPGGGKLFNFRLISQLCATGVRAPSGNTQLLLLSRPRCAYNNINVIRTLYGRFGMLSTDSTWHELYFI